MVGIYLNFQKLLSPKVNFEKIKSTYWKITNTLLELQKHDFACIWTSLIRKTSRWGFLNFCPKFEWSPWMSVILGENFSQKVALWRWPLKIFGAKNQKSPSRSFSYQRGPNTCKIMVLCGKCGPSYFARKGWEKSIGNLAEKEFLYLATTSYQRSLVAICCLEIPSRGPSAQFSLIRPLRRKFNFYPETFREFSKLNSVPP